MSIITAILPHHNAFQNAVCQMSTISAFCIKDGLNSFPPGQNGRHFAEDLLRCIFVNEKFCILIKMSLKFVP